MILKQMLQDGLDWHFEGGRACDLQLIENGPNC